jgi:transcriptional regulator with XRE-family HTH domain
MPKSETPVAFATLGEDIKQAREALNLSRRQLAEMANIDPRYLAKRIIQSR